MDRGLRSSGAPLSRWAWHRASLDKRARARFDGSHHTRMRRSSIKSLFRQIAKLARWQKTVIGLMVLLIVVTWLAVCLVLGVYVGS